MSNLEISYFITPKPKNIKFTTKTYIKTQFLICKPIQTS